MTTGVSNGGCTALAPVDHVQLISIVHIQNNAVLGICIALDRKGHHCSIDIDVYRGQIRIFRHLNHAQINGCQIIIALRIVSRHGNHADHICADLVQLACRNRAAGRGKILANQNIARAVVQVHIVLEGHTGGCSGLVPRNFEAVAYLDLLIICRRDRRCSALTQRIDNYRDNIFTTLNDIPILIQRIYSNLSFTRLVKNMCTDILNIILIFVFIPLNLIEFMTIGI